MVSKGERQSEQRSAAEVRAEAAAWLARLHADDRAPADEAAFRAWRTASPAHAAAFDHLTELWDAAGGLSAAEAAEPRRTGRLGSRTSRRGVLAAGGALLAAGSAFGVWEAAFAGVYETGVGEQRHVALSDGSQMLLDTDTKVRAHLDGSSRRLRLYRGRASLRIAPDAARPFVVTGNGSAVVTPHATLDVRLQGRKLSVLMLQGEASLGQADQPARAHLALEQSGEALTPGARAVLDQDRAVVIDRPEVAPLTAWQSGQAIFDNEPLWQAVDELNRYSTVKLRVADAATGRMRISGVYRVGDNVAFARSVSRLLPLSVAVDGGDVVLASIADGARRSA